VFHHHFQWNKDERTRNADAIQEHLAHRRPAQQSVMSEVWRRHWHLATSKQTLTLNALQANKYTL
jgi:hypothetical protein